MVTRTIVQVPIFLLANTAGESDRSTSNQKTIRHINYQAGSSGARTLVWFVRFASLACSDGSSIISEVFDVPSETLMIEVFGPLMAAFLLLMAAFGIRRLLHQFRNRMTPEQRQAARDSFRRRLVHPNPSEVEQEMGALLPQRLLTLYSDHQTILAEELEIRRQNRDGMRSAEWIEAFLPLDLESQEYTVDLAEHGWGKGFCFATDGAGNFYWVPVSQSRQPGESVFFPSHDPICNQQVSSSLDYFLSCPRTTRWPQAQEPPRSASMDQEGT